MPEDKPHMSNTSTSTRPGPAQPSPTTGPTPPKPPPGALARALGERSTAFWAGAVLGVLLTIATVLLIVQNSESANLDWLGFDFRAPLWLLLFASAISGAILARLAPAIWRHARQRADRRHNTQLGRATQPDDRPRGPRS